MSKKMVAIVMGSASDLETMQKAAQFLDSLNIPYEQKIMSAHRSPEQVRQFALMAQEKGFEVIIAGAGKAAHLPGVIASLTTLPVIGVPMKTADLGGLDSLLSIVQMPDGVPVATVAIGGAKNAAILAAQIIALKHPDFAAKLKIFKEELAKSGEQKAAEKQVTKQQKENWPIIDG